MTKCSNDILYTNITYSTSNSIITTNAKPKSTIEDKWITLPQQPIGQYNTILIKKYIQNNNTLYQL
jgi:hypothetical protein